MSGSGGQKHRLIEQRQKRNQRRKKAIASIRRARGLFEAKGQAWDPLNNPQQMAALNHQGRRHVNRPESAKR